MYELQKHAKQRRLNAKECILYDFIYMKFPEKANLEMTVA